MEQSGIVFGSGAKSRICKNKHICVVTCPTPLIVFNWSTIRRRSGPPLENIVWIITVYRASNRHPLTPPSHSTPPFSGICYLRLQLHGTKCTISPICPPSHALLYFPPSHSVGPSRGANLLPTWLQHRVGRAGKKNSKTKPTLSVLGRGCTAAMCHAICMDWLTLAFSSTRVCLHELQSCLGCRAKVSAAHWTSAEDNAPILPLPLWNKPIISSIVCSQLWAA